MKKYLGLDQKEAKFLRHIVERYWVEGKNSISQAKGVAQ